MNDSNLLSCTLSEKNCPSLCPSKKHNKKYQLQIFPSTLKHNKMQFIIKNTGKTSVRNEYGKSLRQTFQSIRFCMYKRMKTFADLY